MHVLVTGATGGAGSWIVDDLADAGHRVSGVDLQPPDGGRPGVTFYTADLTDQGQAAETIQELDPDAVVHFAAIPHPLSDPGTTVFTTNVESTYNTLVAAGHHGADVVWASSEAAYGSVYAEDPWLPDALPIEESHERRPEDPYGTSKQVGEDVAAMVVRRFGVSVTSIRPAWIQYPGRYEVRSIREDFDPETAEPNGNFWSYVDVRDVVSLVRAALEDPPEGHEAVHCAAAENCLGLQTAEVLEATFGDLPERCALEGEESALSTAKATELFGWEPAHTWREAETEDVAGPAFVDG